MVQLMELILNNPFRVLGLVATASARDIAKRISDLETFAELGKTKSYPTDFPHIGTLNRSIDSIKDAARKIEQVEGKLFHSLFWFRSSNSVDELAFESLATGNSDGALNIWNKVLNRDGVRKYSWYLNRAILLLMKSTSPNGDPEEPFNKGVFNYAINDFGMVINYLLADVSQDVLGSSDTHVDHQVLSKKIADEFIAVILSLPNKPYGTNGVEVIKYCSSFPEDIQDYISSKVVNPIIEQIQKSIQKSEELRSDNDQLASLKKCNGLTKAGKLINELGSVLNENNPKFQSIANEYANELCACAISAVNDYEEIELGSKLIELANKMPSFSRVKSRIQENKETIDRRVKAEKEEVIFSVIDKLLNKDLINLSSAESTLDAMKFELTKIKLELGDKHQTYIAASSACVHHILGFLIDVGNEALESFKTQSHADDFNNLKNTLLKTAGIARKLRTLDMDSEARERLDKNLETLERVYRDLTQRPTRPQAESSQGIIEQIPPWLWVVGFFILLSMCSN